jgi:hypothetical protein
MCKPRVESKNSSSARGPSERAAASFLGSKQTPHWRTWSSGKIESKRNRHNNSAVGQLEILKLENDGLRDFERAGLSDSVDRPVVR